MTMKATAILFLAVLLSSCEMPADHPPLCDNGAPHQWEQWAEGTVNECGWVIQTRRCSKCGVMLVGAHR